MSIGKLILLFLFLFPSFSHADITKGLIGYWKFDDGTGSSATDSSGNGYTISLTASPPWVAGQVGPYALSFNGSTQYGSVSNAALNIANPFTLSFWINIAAMPAAGSAWVIGRGNGTTSSDFWVELYSVAAGQNMVMWVNTSAGTNNASCDTTPNSHTGTWEMCTISFDGSNVVGYRNGALYNSAAYAHTLNTTYQTFIVAQSGSGGGGFLGNYFNGSMDEVRLYNRALTAADVKQLYVYTGIGARLNNAQINNAEFGY